MLNLYNIQPPSLEHGGLGATLEQLQYTVCSVLSELKRMSVCHVQHENVFVDTLCRLLFLVSRMDAACDNYIT